MTQSPEGNKTANAHGAYTAAALWELNETGGDVVVDTKLTADAPTIAESGYSGTNCLHVDVTTAESAVGAAESLGVQYFMTGSDFAHLHQQQITISFWHKHTKTGVFCGYFMNSAENRSYVYEYTQSSTNTWEKHTETLALDTSGTWLLTEADIGLRVGFCMYGGSTFQGTADSWEGAKDYCTSNQVAGADSSSNFCKFSQVGLYLGSSAPSAFLGEPVTTVQQQVEWYIETTDDNGVHPSTGGMSSGTFDGISFADNGLSGFVFKTKKRVDPTIKIYDMSGLLASVTNINTNGDTGATVAQTGISRNGVLYHYKTSTFSVGMVYFFHALIDARH